MIQEVGNWLTIFSAFLTFLRLTWHERNTPYLKSYESFINIKRTLNLTCTVDFYGLSQYFENVTVYLRRCHQLYFGVQTCPIAHIRSLPLCSANLMSVTSKTFVNSLILSKNISIFSFKNTQSYNRAFNRNLYILRFSYNN